MCKAFSSLTEWNDLDDLATAAQIIADWDERLKPPLLSDLNSSKFPQSYLLSIALLDSKPLISLIESRRLSFDQIATILVFRSELQKEVDIIADSMPLDETTKLKVTAIVDKCKEWNGPSAQKINDETNDTIEGIQNIFLVGPSGAGKTTIITKGLNTNHIPVVELDSILFKNIESRSEFVHEFGVQNVICRAESMFKTTFNSDDYRDHLVDMGAVFLLSPFIRRCLRRTNAHVIALDCDTDSLINRVFQGNGHDVGLANKSDDAFFLRVFWMRRALALSVATERLHNNDNLFSYTISRVSQLCTQKTLDNQSTEEFYPEYANSEYYGGPSSIVQSYSHMFDVPECEILDVGCGEGRNSAWLTRQFSHSRVTGIDYSLLGLSHAQSITRQQGFGWRTSFHYFDLENISDNEPQWFDQRFNFLVAATTLSHIRPDLIDRVIRFIRYSLDDLGVALISAFTIDDAACDDEVNELASPTANHVKKYFAPGELLLRLQEYFEVFAYNEYTYLDTGHGEPHIHGIAEGVFYAK